MKRKQHGSCVLAFGSLMMLASAAAMAGEADVVGVKIIKEGTGTYRFDVSVRHADEGWTHYADAWEVLTPGGTVLGARELAHPHENEQPFTRSLSGVRIPEAVNQVTVRARDLVHGFGGTEMRLEVPR